MIPKNSMETNTYNKHMEQAAHTLLIITYEFFIAKPSLPIFRYASA